MNTEKLFEFQTLAKTLHFGQAAQKLYMSQSILSRHIQSMEQELGVQLFTRTPRGVTLTAAGETLYQASFDFLQSCSLSLERVRTAGIGVVGSVRFACLRPVMRDGIEEFFRYFRGAHPDILLTCDVLVDHEQCVLSDYHCLAMPTSSITVPPNFRLHTTLREKSWLVLPYHHRLQPGGEISLSELAGETLFIPGYHGSIGSFARIRQMAEQATGGQVRIIRVANPETALLNTGMGKGFSILPRHLLDERSHSYPHSSIRENCTFETLLYLNETVDEPAARLFADEFCRLLDSDKTE